MISNENYKYLFLFLSVPLYYSTFLQVWVLSLFFLSFSFFPVLYHSLVRILLYLFFSFNIHCIYHSLIIILYFILNLNSSISFNKIYNTSINFYHHYTTALLILCYIYNLLICICYIFKSIHCASYYYYFYFYLFKFTFFRQMYHTLDPTNNNPTNN